MRRGPRIREGRLKVLEELNHLVPASQDPRLGPGRRQSILELIGERGVGGFHIARVPGSVPLLKTLSERAKELGLSSWHSPAQDLPEGSAFPCGGAVPGTSLALLTRARSRSSTD